MNNTDPNLTNTDTFNDGETSITVNPANPNEVVVTAFSGSWGANALAVAFDRWRKCLDQAIYNPCAARDSCNIGCPCDQTIDYGMANQMAGTFLILSVHLQRHNYQPSRPPRHGTGWLLVASHRPQISITCTAARRGRSTLASGKYRSD